MRIDEITYGSGIQSLARVLNINNSTKIGTCDNIDVYKMDLGNGTCYFLYDPDIESYLSYVAVDQIVSNGYLHLRQIENVSGIKGSVSTLMYFLTRNKNFRFVISKEEPLTIDGLRWVISTISSDRKLFNFKDSSGQPPDVDDLKKEWENSRIDPSYSGKITIFIESINGNSFNNIFESNTGLLHRMYRIFKDVDLI
jgi:hypothetical protein